MYIPVMTLKAVVLPAPFGPIRPTISFFPISMLSSETAVRPPNLMTTRSVESMVSGIPASLARLSGFTAAGQLRAQAAEHVP